jgi:hypothetical protein
VQYHQKWTTKQLYATNDFDGSIRTLSHCKLRWTAQKHPIETGRSLCHEEMFDLTYDTLGAISVTAAQ